MGDISAAIAANTKFTADNILILAERICELIAIGWGLQQALDSNADFPKATTFYEWLEKYPAVTELYTRARYRQQDYETDQMIIIADTEVDPNKARVRIDARKWRAAKLAPRKYGDTVAHEHSGPDGQPITIVTGVPRPE